MAEIKAKDCNDCPFNTFGGWEGEITYCAGVKPMKKIATDHEGVEKVPKWCPLPLTVIRTDN